MKFKEVDRLYNIIKNKRPLNQSEINRLYKEFTIENTYNSNAIEGNTITLRETALIIQEGITIAEKPIKEHLDIIGYKDAFEYVLSISDKDEELTENVIKNIHSLVLMNNAENKGIYRKIPVSIVGAEKQPVEPYLINFEMENLLDAYKQLKKSLHIIEAIAIFHLKFEDIHPFIDGNGRTGRLILNLELIKAGLLPINIKFSDRQLYYSCFDDYIKNNSSDKLTELILKYEIKELTKRINTLNNYPLD